MDAMCNEHEIHTPFVLLVMNSDLKNCSLQLWRKSGGNISHNLASSWARFVIWRSFGPY